MILQPNSSLQFFKWIESQEYVLEFPTESLEGITHCCPDCLPLEKLNFSCQEERKTPISTQQSVYFSKTFCNTRRKKRVPASSKFIFHTMAPKRYDLPSFFLLQNPASNPSQSGQHLKRSSAAGLREKVNNYRHLCKPFPWSSSDWPPRRGERIELGQSTGVIWGALISGKKELFENSPSSEVVDNCWFFFYLRISRSDI